MQFQCRCECATDYVCIVPVTQDDKSLMTDIDAKSCIYIYIYIFIIMCGICIVRTIGFYDLKHCLNSFPYCYCKSCIFLHSERCFQFIVDHAQSIILLYTHVIMSVL